MLQLIGLNATSAERGQALEKESFRSNHARLNANAESKQKIDKQRPAMCRAFYCLEFINRFLIKN